MESKKAGKEVVGLNSGLFNASFASFSNLQDFPFFESLASLGDLSSLAAFQSIPSLPEHLFEEARAAASAALQAGQQGSTTNLNLALGRSDSFANLTQSSLQNLGLYLTQETEGQSVTPSQPTTTVPPQHLHHSQQAQPLPAAAAAQGSTSHKHSSLPQLKAGPSPIAPAPVYSSAPSQYAAFSPSLGGYPPSQHNWGPLSRQPASQPGKLPLPASAPMVSSSSLASPPPSAPPAPTQEFSSTLYSLASTLPPPVVLSNDSVLGSVGGGLHFQRHCVRRRMPDELTHDPNVFLN